MTPQSPAMPRSTIAIFMGTRPEAIKMAPVIKALEHSTLLQPVVISTGQHREMLQQVIDIFGISVDRSLDVMHPDQNLAALSSRLLTVIDGVLDDVKPRMALVQGDTTTVLMASLACFYRRLPLGHVEAGLRTGNIWSPFPEEANRRLSAPLASLHFAPTASAASHLLREGVDPATVHITGNTVIDALLLEVARQRDIQTRAAINEALDRVLGAEWQRQPYVLITGHRRENFGRGFDEICRALTVLAQRFRNYLFVFPVHLNPNVQRPVYERLGMHANIRLIPPQPYAHFVTLMSTSRVVLTDSGGVQEEAPSLGKPVLVMRDTTERPEAVEAGTVELVGAEADRIIDRVTALLTNNRLYSKMSESVNPYGDGMAAERIVRILEKTVRASVTPTDAEHR